MLPAHLVSTDVDECVGEEHCAPHGECLNSHGSFFCLCAPGFASAEQGTSCQGEKLVWPCLGTSSRDPRGCVYSRLHLNTSAEIK
jgi:hypothetical protein